MEIDIMQILGSYGFPIVACLLMGWYIKYITDTHREDRKEDREERKEETKSHENIMLSFKDSLTEALNNNTIALNSLTTKLNLDRKEKEEK